MVIMVVVMVIVMVIVCHRHGHGHSQGYDILDVCKKYAFALCHSHPEDRLGQAWARVTAR